MILMGGICLEIAFDGSWRDPKIDMSFPLEVVRHEHLVSGPIFERHWHGEFQLIYCETGCGLIYCNSEAHPITAGEIVIVNSNELHFGENRSAHLVYQVIKFDLSFLFSSRSDSCQEKYIAPLLANQIRFLNKLEADAELKEQVLLLIDEYERREDGYELIVKACSYRIVACLLRRHRDRQSAASQKRRAQLLQRIKPTLHFIEEHYAEKLTLLQLAALANMSAPHFCRQFKAVSGKAPIEYINHLRINRAVTLLQQAEMNISEVALAVGFDDINYFSRMFKKYKHLSPSKLRK